MNKKFFLVCMALVAVSFQFGCKKTKESGNQQIKAGTGTFMIGTVSFSTKDTLAPDVFSGLEDVTMWPTTGNQNIMFIYNMPTADTGTTQFTDGNNANTVYLLGAYQGSNGTVNFASNGVTGSVTKTSATSFTFSATVYNDTEPDSTFQVQGSGTY